MTTQSFVLAFYALANSCDHPTASFSGALSHASVGWMEKARHSAVHFQQHHNWWVNMPVMFVNGLGLQPFEAPPPPSCWPWYGLAASACDAVCIQLKSWCFARTGEWLRSLLFWPFMHWRIPAIILRHPFLAHYLTLVWAEWKKRDIRQCTFSSTTIDE